MGLKAPTTNNKTGSTLSSPRLASTSDSVNHLRSLYLSTFVPVMSMPNKSFAYHLPLN